MTLALFLSLVMAAEPNDNQTELLKLFRSEFVLITPGTPPYPKTFKMGRDGAYAAEQPAHEVTVREPFSLAKYELPQDLWEAVMGNNPSKWKGERNSVERITFDEAQAFCQRATELMRKLKLITANEVIRLPTEAEWEYAARAGTTTVYSFGNSAATLGEYAWFTGNATGNDPPVGAKKPNPAGLYDMHGYLWEWCQDPWHPDYQGAPSDAAAWIKGGESDRRVLRSGSWKDPVGLLTSTFRRNALKDLKDDAVGLRCVLAVQKK